MWKCEDVEMWRCGNMEIWKCFARRSLTTFAKVSVVKKRRRVKILAPGVKLLKDIPQDAEAFVNKPYPDLYQAGALIQS